MIGSFGGWAAATLIALCAVAGAHAASVPVAVSEPPTFEYRLGAGDKVLVITFGE